MLSRVTLARSAAFSRMAAFSAPVKAVSRNSPFSQAYRSLVSQPRKAFLSACTGRLSRIYSLRRYAAPFSTVSTRHSMASGEPSAAVGHTPKVT